MHEVLCESVRRGVPFGADLEYEQRILFAPHAHLPINRTVGIVRSIVDSAGLDTFHTKIIFDWVYGIWWREKLPAHFFSKSKSHYGNTFKILNEGGIRQRNRLLRQLTKDCDFLPKYILDMTGELTPAFANWSNMMENLVQFRLKERDTRVFQVLATDQGFAFVLDLLKHIEMALVWDGTFAQTTDRAEKSYDRFRANRNHLASLPKSLREIANRDPMVKAFYVKINPTYRDLPKGKPGRPPALS